MTAILGSKISYNVKDNDNSNNVKDNDNSNNIKDDDDDEDDVRGYRFTSWSACLWLLLELNCVLYLY